MARLVMFEKQWNPDGELDEAPPDGVSLETVWINPEHVVRVGEWDAGAVIQMLNGDAVYVTAKPDAAAHALSAPTMVANPLPGSLHR